MSAWVKEWNSSILSSAVKFNGITKSGDCDEGSWSRSDVVSFYTQHE